jgi:hypothetical protein
MGRDKRVNSASRKAFDKNWRKPSEDIEWQKRSMKMKTRTLLAVLALAFAPLGQAGNKAAYPTEKVAAFVTEKLDLTSLPSTFQLKRAKGKKTIADYGFIAQIVSENEAVIQAASGAEKFAITILDQTSSGIYACVAEPGENGGTARTQTVIFLKRKDASALLRARESWREFAACPVIGGSDSTTSAYGD